MMLQNTCNTRRQPELGTFPDGSKSYPPPRQRRLVASLTPLPHASRNEARAKYSVAELHAQLGKNQDIEHRKARGPFLWTTINQIWATPWHSGYSSLLFWATWLSRKLLFATHGCCRELGILFPGVLIKTNGGLGPLILWKLPLKNGCSPNNYSA